MTVNKVNRTHTWPPNQTLHLIITIDKLFHFTRDIKPINDKIIIVIELTRPSQYTRHRFSTHKDGLFRPIHLFIIWLTIKQLHLTMCGNGTLLFFRYDTKTITMGDFNCVACFSFMALMPPLIKLSNWKQYFIYLLIKAFLLLIYDKTWDRIGNSIWK